MIATDHQPPVILIAAAVRCGIASQPVPQSGGRIRRSGRDAPCLKTIQDCPKDLRAALRQAGRAENRLRRGRRLLVVMTSSVDPTRWGRKPHVRHEAARVHHAARRRGGSVAGCGAGAAAGNAGHRITRPEIARRDPGSNARISPGAQGHRLCRGRERGDRIPLRRGSIRAAARACGRTGSQTSRRDRRDQHCCRPLQRRQQLRQFPSSSPSRRPGGAWTCREPRSAGRQCDRYQFLFPER